MSDSILLTRDGGLARVTFNRPAYLNAMDFDMGTLWRDIAHEVTVRRIRGGRDPGCRRPGVLRRRRRRRDGDLRRGR